MFNRHPTYESGSKGFFLLVECKAAWSINTKHSCVALSAFVVFRVKVTKHLLDQSEFNEI